MVKQYPNFENVNFYKKIFIKKEFKQFYNKNNKINSIKSNHFQLQPQQSFLKKYISINTPYNSVLVFHGTGVGKTCTAINIAENFKYKLYKSNKRILVILPRSIRSNFIKELYNITKPDNKQCIGTIYKYTDSYKNASPEKKVYNIRSNIKKYYQFYGYEQFANYVIRSTGWNGNISNIKDEVKNFINKKYSNRVIIIDEIHHLKSTKDSLIKKVPPILESIAKYANNIKFVLMSATPMYDSPKEIIYLLNIMLLNDNREKIKDSDIFDSNGNITNKGIDNLKNISRGYISYYRGENFSDFPYKIYAKKSITPKFKFDIKGNKNKTNLNYLKLFPTYFTNNQYNFYNSFINSNMLEDKYDTENKKNNLKKNKVMILQQISNIVFPIKGNKKFTYGKNGFQLNNNGNGAFYTSKIKRGKKTYKYYKYQDHVLTNKGQSNEKSFLDLSILNNISPKINNIIKQILNSKGISYVYSEYVDSGTLPIALALEQAGYERFTLHGENQLLDYSKNEKGGGGKSNPKCYLCGKEITDKIHHPSNHSKDAHQFKVGKYIIIAGNIIDNKNVVQEYINILNSSNNKNGEIIKVIIGTRVTGEGVDLKGIRQIHILEPWWNLSRLQQIIGRGIRYKSHLHLDELYRNVELFQYVALPPLDQNSKSKETETIDVYTYKQAELKDIQIKRVEYILKQSSIDCNFFKKNNVRIINKTVNQITASNDRVNIKIGDKPYSQECSYMKDCNYKCNWCPSKIPNEINNNTYQINYSTDEINNAIIYIKKIFKTGYIFNLMTIFKYINKFKNINKIFVFYALNKLINDKIIIKDKFRKKGYIIYRGDYYIFQPLDIAHNDVPIYYRNLIRQIKTNSIKININNNTNKKENINLNNLYKNIQENFNTYKSFLNQYLYNNVKYSDEIIISIIIDAYPLDIINKLYLNKNKNKLIKIYFDRKFDTGLDIKNNKIIEKYSKYKNKLADISGVLLRNNKKGSFKFYDNSKSKNNLTISKKKSKRSIMKGRVCITYDIYLLKDIYTTLNRNIFKLNETKIKKNIYCFMIEFIIRYNQLTNYKNKTWFVYKK